MYAPDLYECVIRINQDYHALSQGRFAENILLNYARHIRSTDLSDSVSEYDKQFNLCDCSLGQGQWASIPWIAIFNRKISITAQRGYYIVFLFSPAEHKVYITLNQGFTSFKENYSSQVLNKIKTITNYWRTNLVVPKGFSTNEIDLSQTLSKYAHGYAAGSIFSKPYTMDAFPSRKEFYNDINQLLKAFKELDNKLVLNFEETNRNILDGQFTFLSKAQIVEDIGTDDRTSYVNNSLAPEGKRREIYTTKYERILKNREACLRIQGTTCKVCGFNFGLAYGKWGLGFIEVHHIKPLYSLEEEIIIDPAKDLVPVCSNCHRMIHRKKNQIITINELRAFLKLN